MRDNEYIELILRIIIFLDAVDKVTDYEFLVSCGNYDSVLKLSIGMRKFLFSEKSHDGEYDEVYDHQREHGKYHTKNEIYNVKISHNCSFFIHFFILLQFFTHTF